MKRVVLIFWILGAAAVQAEIIDRIVGVVNQHIITLSDIRQERLIRDLLGSKESKDDKTILQELINAQIIEEQISEFPGIVVTGEQVDAELSKIPDLRGLPRELVREAIRRRLRIAEFFEVRFRQFLRATDEEIQQYYETVFAPAARTSGLTPVPAIEQVADRVRTNVIEEKMTREIDTWLEATRRRSDIEVFE